MLVTERADGTLSKRGKKRLVARTPQRLVFHGIKGALVLTAGGFFRTDQELLWVFWTDERWYNVIVFLTPGGDLDAWRCHVTLPPVIADRRLTMTDLGMDVSARPASAARAFDAGDPARLRAAGTIDDAMAARAEATAALLVEGLENGIPPITERETAILLHRAQEGETSERPVVDA
jgi:protein associated with RNAse G/E